MLKNQKSDRFCRQTPSSENDFLVKFSQNSIKLASCGIHRQNLCSPLCCCAKCQFCNIIRCGKIFVFLTKKHQKMVSLNVPFLLNGATFEIYSYEKFFQFRLPKVLSKESGEYFILCQIADGLYTGRRKGKFIASFE